MSRIKDVLSRKRRPRPAPHIIKMCEELRSRLEKYLKNAKALFENLETQIPESINRIDEIAPEFHQMAISYYRDAIHFYENGEYINALAALEYAEGWLDAGKRLGILKVR
ncbi:MAG: hypothetical protein B6U86_00985 [Candidatus Altiarchaeales archaeon ex4484_43]|nr:MAG: hypothetical protein B6U86_00985 [Candidatus Altiarchaeales archaeon ex4484_43]RLI88621.1 MAG: DUF357 domain-containing protein [Candidatus Altiarchaeales archaeon]